MNIKGISTKVIEMPTIKPLDIELILQTQRKLKA
ncbi:hypothetical protein EQM13_01720 [Acidilutibacter cellobiosedens]|uniref:Uncharacterized protein n=1 Tax=Acidilutibacter cellobiosedens TaxID=2507161 RepID=A0A410QH83_9FIRM|nr:hypothetical protein EQM13_01720 [Acidilutibacter cellobiosedens]